MPRSTILSVVLLAPVLTHAQVPVAPPRLPQPVATVVMRGSETRAPDVQRAAHITPTATDWQFRVDSIANGTVSGYSVPDSRAWPDAMPRAVVERREGRVVASRVVVEPWPLAGPAQLRPFGTPLPRDVGMIAARHRMMRRVLEHAHLFEGIPAAGGGASTLQFSDSAGGFRLHMRTVRQSRVLGDTVLGDRAVTAVRDSTTVTLEHVYPTVARFVRGARGQVEEQLTGTITGVRFVDPLTSTAVLVHDTINLRGTMVLDDQFDGTMRTPLTVIESREGSFRDASWQPLAPRAPFDMVTADQRARVEPTVSYRDSLLDVIATSRSILARDSARRRFGGTGMERWREMAMARSLAVGDTGSVVDMIDDNPYWRPPLTLQEYRLLREALRDAAFAFRHGIARELVAVNLVDGLSYRPPALGSTSPFCEPATCTAMAADMAAPRESPLFAVALVARMVTEPRVWTDSVVHYSATNEFLNVGNVRVLSFGQASTAVASAKAPIPEPDAPDDAWRHWLTGIDSAYARLRAESAVRLPSRGPQPVFSPSQTAGMAVRFTELRTGKPYAATIRQRRAAATADTARALFTALSMSIGEAVYSDAELVRVLLDPGSAQRQVAVMELNRRGDWQRAPDSTQDQVARLVVAHAFGRGTIPAVDSTVMRAPFMRIRTSDSLPFYVSMDSLPESVRAYAAQLGFAPQPRGWQLVPGNSGVQTHFEPVMASGSFVQMRVAQMTLHRRTETRSGGFANGYTLTLVRTAAGWVVVNVSSWVA